MSFFSWRQWLRRLSGSPRPRLPKAPKARKARRLDVEHLETRLAPATFIWTGLGGAANPKWSNSANWLSGTAPTGSASAFDDLVFDSRASQRATVDDLQPGGQAVFNSITVSSSNYTLTPFNNVNPALKNSITLGKT